MPPGSDLDWVCFGFLLHRCLTAICRCLGVGQGTRSGLSGAVGSVAIGVVGGVGRPRSQGLSGWSVLWECLCGGGSGGGLVWGCAVQGGASLGFFWTGSSIAGSAVRLSGSMGAPNWKSKDTPCPRQRPAPFFMTSTQALALSSGIWGYPNGPCGSPGNGIVFCRRNAHRICRPCREVLVVRLWMCSVP